MNNISGLDFSKFRFRYRLTTVQIIVAAFFAVILAGAVLLCLPVSSAAGVWTAFPDALFTSVSATCVTGLIVHDTALYWSLFGKIVIICLIQIGGLGVITMAFLVSVFMGSKISLVQRTLLVNSISGDNVRGIVQMSLFILRTVLIIEAAGAAALMPAFIRDFGPVQGIAYAFFHSISAFCNAGFDLCGVREPYSSLTSYAADPLVNIVVMLLILAGGLGFYTWRDIKRHGVHFKRYQLQSKIILTVNLILVLVPAVIFALTEYRDLPAGERLLASFFQSVTTRTAGFNTTDLSQFSEAGILLMLPLMLAGGAPGSTAGGMKMTTLAIVFAVFMSVLHRQDDAVLFQRRIPRETVRSAMTICAWYVTVIFAGTLLVSYIEDAPVLACLFETTSALNTVGLTLGLTPGLHLGSKIILMLMMFMGRVGSLTFLYAVSVGDRSRSHHLPQENVNVG